LQVLRFLHFLRQTLSEACPGRTRRTSRAHSCNAKSCESSQQWQSYDSYFPPRNTSGYEGKSYQHAHSACGRWFLSTVPRIPTEGNS
jgi:hypothetical protein